MASIVKYELPEAIENASLCECKPEGDQKVAIVKRKATAIYDDDTQESNKVISLLFCSECGTYISKEPAHAENEYRSMVEDRQQED